MCKSWHGSCIYMRAQQAFSTDDFFWGQKNSMGEMPVAVLPVEKAAKESICGFAVILIYESAPSHKFRVFG